MIKNEKMISDTELDMVVGGASTLFLRKREDKKIDSVLATGMGEYEKKIERVMRNRELGEIASSEFLKIATGIRESKLNDFIELQKKNNHDLEIKWVK